MTKSTKTLVVILSVCLIFDQIDSSPLFFFNSQSSKQVPDSESENVSIYTTAEPLPNETTTRQPSIYQQIARNVIERLTSPLVSHFVQARTTDRSAKLISTNVSSKNKKNEEKMIEILDEEIPETEDLSNEKEKPIDHKERPNPHFVKTNPSFNTKYGRGKPERIVLFTQTKLLEKDNVASEVNDLNMIINGIVSSQPDAKDVDEDNDEDNEVENVKDAEEIDPIHVVPKILQDVNKTCEEDEDYDDFPEITTVPTKTKDRNFSESYVVYVLELVASVFTILNAVVGSLYGSANNMMRK